MLTAVAEEWSIGLVLIGGMFLLGGWLVMWMAKPRPDDPDDEQAAALARGYYLGGLVFRWLGVVALAVGLVLELVLAVQST